jgi:hypothetical protein
MLRSLLRFALLTVTAVGAFADERVPLKTELPPPLLVGTPVPARLPNLERAPAEPPTVLVPASTVNLALGKTVTASDDEPLIGDASLITDGDKSAEEGSFVEFGPGKQWVQIDLESSSTIYAVWVWHFHAQLRAYIDVVVQVSDDPDFLQGVTTLFNNDHDNSSGLGVGKHPAYLETHRGRLMPAPTGGVKGRYVRLTSAGNTSNNLNHYIEVEVFGTPGA